MILRITSICLALQWFRIGRLANRLSHGLLTTAPHMLRTLDIVHQRVLARSQRAKLDVEH